MGQAHEYFFTSLVSRAGSELILAEYKHSYACSWNSRVLARTSTAVQYMDLQIRM
jgi:hypothetical protein